MYLRWNLFKSYCIDHNIQLLKDDFKFIEHELMKIEKNLHRSVLKSYTDEWLSELEKEENSQQKQNLGRRKANTWLREYCDERNL